MFNTNRKIISIILTLVVLAIGVSAVFAEDAVTIKTLFKLLPEKALNPTFKDFNLDAARRDSYIEVCDEENRYLSLQNKYGFEMCYWNLKGGKKLILVSYGGPYPELFYLYSKGKISETNDFGIKALKEYIEKTAAIDDWIQFYPPQQGTSLVVTIGPFDCIVFKWQKEKFVRLNDYPQKNSDYSTLVKGFVQALNAHDADACLQYIEPGYIREQCMGMLQGRTEKFICELIAGQNEDSEYIEPHSLKDIKKASYRLNSKSNFMITIELKDGRAYTYFPEIEEVEVIKKSEGNGKIIPYLVGAMG